MMQGKSISEGVLLNSFAHYEDSQGSNSWKVIGILPELIAA
jgi:hypothetical protein